MKAIWKSKGEKIHTRNIAITTYNYDKQRIIVEGILKDDRFQEFHTITGETFPSGVIHHMSLCLLVNCSNHLIEDLHTDLISVPREECRETIGCLASIKGLTITKGFTSKVKKIAGGKRGCVHLLELLLAMAPAAFQGQIVHQSRKPLSYDPDRAKGILESLVNTCRVWSEEGPFVERFKKAFNMK